MRWLLVLVALSQVRRGDAFAAWMMKDFCDRELIEGEIIMNEAAIATNERHVRVFRDETELTSSSVYVPSEVLSIQISDSTGQFVLESQHAEFVGGGCKHKNRVVKNHASLKMPESGTVNVTIKAGWAMGHQQVHLTPTFVLSAPRKRKSAIPGKHSHEHGDHHRAIGSDTLSDISKKVGGLFGGGSSKHSKEKHEKSVKEKERKLNAEKEKSKKHGAVDHDKELHAGVKQHKRIHTKENLVHADFETKEEADKEQKDAEAGHKKKGKKAHWRHAAKIIEKKLRGEPAEDEDANSIVAVFFGLVALVLVFIVYSLFRANRFRLGKLFSKDTGFKE